VRPQRRAGVVFSFGRPLKMDTPLREETPVVAGVLWRQGRFLAVRRPEGKPLAGFWEFPGGKTAPCETLEQALVREFQEELGVTPRDVRYWKALRHEYGHLTVRLHFFHIHAAQGEPTPLEGQTLAWLTPSQALDYQFLPADQDVIHELDAFC